MQKLMSRIRSAAQKYNMINDGDVIAVGVSGGKDSVALLCALSEMRRFYPKKQHREKAGAFSLCSVYGIP